jgi:hypothetical protein
MQGDRPKNSAAEYLHIPIVKAEKEKNYFPLLFFIKND